MSNDQIPNPKYDLEERTARFAEQVRLFVKSLPRSIATIEDSKQLVRASGSQAANYIEANESVSKRDFVHRIKICRKEAKESCLWLRLIDVSADENVTKDKNFLLDEAIQLRKIFTAILDKSV